MIYGGFNYIYRAIEKSECFRIKGHEAVCRASYMEYMIGMGIVEVLLSQIPNFDKLSFLSLFAAVMSLAYASIGAGLAFVKFVSGTISRTRDHFFLHLMIVTVLKYEKRKKNLLKQCRLLFYSIVTQCSYMFHFVKMGQLSPHVSFHCI